MVIFDGKNTFRCKKRRDDIEDENFLPLELEAELRADSIMRPACQKIFDQLKAERIELKDAVRLMAANGIEAMIYHIPKEECIAWLENWIKTIQQYQLPTEEEVAEFNHRREVDKHIELEARRKQE